MWHSQRQSSLLHKNRSRQQIEEETCIQDRAQLHRKLLKVLDNRQTASRDQSVLLATLPAANLYRKLRRTR